MKSEDGKKTYVLVTDEDRKEETLTRVGNDRVIFNSASVEVRPHGVIVESERGGFTLYPWAQVLWMDSGQVDDLR